jgi:hypothetical protein
MTLSILTPKEFCYAECRNLFIIVLTVLMLSVAMLLAAMLSVAMLNVAMLSVVMLDVVVPLSILFIFTKILSIIL